MFYQSKKDRDLDFFEEESFCDKKMWSLLHLEFQLVLFYTLTYKKNSIKKKFNKKH